MGISNRRYQRERRARLAARGDCQWCGKRPALPSKKDPTKPGSRCEACAKKARKSASSIIARHREGWLAVGLCVCCGKNWSLRKTCPGVTDDRCAACADYQDEYKSKRRAHAKEVRSNHAA